MRLSTVLFIPVYSSTTIATILTNTITDQINQLTNIYQLINDVKEFINSREELDIPMTIHFGERKEPPTLRLSKLGEMCPCHLWHSIHRPELAEPLPPEAVFKFSYGHTIEKMAIELAKAAGHHVCGEQDELYAFGVKGHRDCVLDGCIVDVKSCSKHMYEKFERKAIASDDSFGYLAQLDGYLVGSADDDLVKVKDRAYIWYIDKTLGKMGLYEHRFRPDFIAARIQSHKRIVDEAQPPRCTCGTVKDGESGNFKLDVKASYSPFKKVCFPQLRTFLYKEREGTKPVYLSKVVRVPNVPELTLH